MAGLAQLPQPCKNPTRTRAEAGESHIFAPGMMTARVITTIHG